MIDRIVFGRFRIRFGFEDIVRNTKKIAESKNSKVPAVKYYKQAVGIDSLREAKEDVDNILSGMF